MGSENERSTKIALSPLEPNMKWHLYLGRFFCFQYHGLKSFEKDERIFRFMSGFLKTGVRGRHQFPITTLR